jgi:PhzF family phenazine biosynthesis protein
MHDTLGWMQRRFAQVDVFTDVPYTGNPVAVVLDGDGIGGGDMQRVARWTNLSETTFVLPPTTSDADYRVRIFTTAIELPFAGHPTLGTCHAWLAAGGTPRSSAEIVQECAAGLIRIRRDGERLAFAAPPLRRSGPADSETVERLAAAFGLDHSAIEAAEWVDNGPGFIALLLAGADAVLAAEPTFIDAPVGLVGFHPPGSATAIEVRGFFPDRGTLVEDPVTGSLNAGIAQWLTSSGRIEAPYVASQGTALGRAGRVHVSADDGDLWVGGGTVTCIDGTIEI